MPTYIPNVTDKQQTDIESANNHSAMRLMWFNGKVGQEGQSKLLPAYDFQNDNGARPCPNNGVVKVAKSVIGSWSDKAHRFERPGA